MGKNFWTANFVFQSPENIDILVLHMILEVFLRGKIFGQQILCSKAQKM